jgi:hypothetical protein
MKSTTVVGAAFVTLLSLLVFAQHPRAFEPETHGAGATEEGNQGFLYGRVTTDAGASHVGRLRFGRDQEAFWGDYFNGRKSENPWAAHAQLTQKRRQISIFEFEVPVGEQPIDLGRQRSGDAARRPRDRALWRS